MLHNGTADRPRSFKSLVIVLLTALLSAGGGAFITSRMNLFQPAIEAPAVALPEIVTVTGLERLEPRGEVVRLSSPSSAEGNRIERLLVEEGSWVRKGETIAILDSRDRLEALLNEAREKVRVSQANLNRIQAGAQQGAIEAQRATISRIQGDRRTQLAAQEAEIGRLQAELNNAKVEYDRYQSLYNEGAISASNRDSKRLNFDRLQWQLQEAKAERDRVASSQQEQLREARATLDRITEVRPVDVEVATAELNAARAAVDRAQTDLDRAFVRSPQAGQILKIHTRPGEIIASEGIAEIGQTREMYAIAEIYESDISKIRTGQPAIVTSNAVPEELRGTVEHIGLQVLRQDVINADPSANIDARVIEVRVKLDETSREKVLGLTNLQVTVAIEL
ncbi:ABC exporter membrane fusion protein [Spirulina sp. 06S082]|uniref:ABC exporter membrane fusion protein n=1 Tax=Spirulina sp. 06S082 TaxID=3110248 RepID=UPI002B20E0C6|nr:ABC exporter membrane fusion protein [Spirulina sp. 06S082]MEA5472523.1 ABC exporter membrane fusion protein [Spirulina sp. 06S082]